MKINWTILIIAGFVMVVFVVYLVIRNRRDQKELEHKLNEDYPKPKEGEHTTDADDMKGT